MLERMVKCCKRDIDGDGNCDVHSAPGVFRIASLNSFYRTREILRCVHCGEVTQADAWGDDRQRYAQNAGRRTRMTRALTPSCPPRCPTAGSRARPR